MISVQTTSESKPSVVAGSGVPAVRPKTVLSVYRGLVPMSPKTTPNAERPSAGRLPEIAGRRLLALAALGSARGGDCSIIPGFSVLNRSEVLVPA
jgi:hypothetical protein